MQAANMIELGQIRAAVVVGTESGRALVEATIDHLNADTSLSRKDIKAAFASLTIGSGSAAIVLCDRELSRTGNRLLGGVMHTATEHCELCQGGHSETNLPSPAGRGAGGEGQREGGNQQPRHLLMWTDSEALMREGVAAARDAFADFLAEMEWTAGDIHKTFCHQVGRAHQRLLFETLGLEPADRLFHVRVSRQHGLGGPADDRGDRHRKRPPAQGRSRGPVGHRLRHQRDHARRGVAAEPCGQTHLAFYPSYEKGRSAG